MAKLNGVKVLDMADGNVTKVAYKGAEYAKVSGNAEVGDLVLCANDASFFTKGAFYLAWDTYEGGDPRMKDDYDDNFGMRDGGYVLFRKVSAETTSTIDERVDSLEKRVGKMEEKLAPSFKEGDLVVITGSGDIGEFSTHGFEIGELVRVRIGLEDTVAGDRFRGESLKTKHLWYVHNSYARHATPAERQAYEESLKPKLKAGDWVKIEDKSDGITAGKKYEVIIDEDDGELCVIDDDGDKNCVIHNEPYEIVAPPTAFEHLGRKEGEFKVGDVVRVIKTGTHHFNKDEVIEIIAFKRNGLNEIKGKRFSEKTSGMCPYLYEREIELIAPVESRVDRSDRPCA